MPSSAKRERELARRRYERQAARRAARRAAFRRRSMIAGAALLVLGGGGGAAAAVLTGGSAAPASVKQAAATPTPTPTASASPSAAVTAVACGAVAPPAPKRMTFPKAPAMTIDPHAAYTMTLHTSCGVITVALDAAQAPRTVNALSFLAAKGYFNGTFCHRETSSASLTVLQCGDPTGTGTGGPGFTLPTENTAGAKYTRGTMAMANTGAPNSTGSQFFLVDKNSQLPPSYTVVGHITGGLAVLDKIFTYGQNNANGPGDGAPNRKVYLNSVTVTRS